MLHTDRPCSDLPNSAIWEHRLGRERHFKFLLSSQVYFFVQCQLAKTRERAAAFHSTAGHYIHAHELSIAWLEIQSSITLLSRDVATGVWWCSVYTEEIRLAIMTTQCAKLRCMQVKQCFCMICGSFSRKTLEKPHRSESEAC